MRSSVLIVEPDPDLRTLAVDALAGAGISGLAGASLDEVLRRADGRPTHAIVLDVSQAHVHRLADFAIARGAPIPVIVTLPRGENHHLKEALEAARWHDLVMIAGLLEKPFSGEKLLRSLGAVQLPTRDVSVDILIEEDVVFRADRSGEVEVAALDPGGGRGELSEAATEQIRVPDDVRDLRRADLGDRLVDRLVERAGALLPVDPEDRRALRTAARRAIEDEEILDGLVPAGPGEVALAGFLGHVPIDQVMQIAGSVTPYARCRLESEGRSVDVYFDGQQVVYARQDNLPEGFLLGRFLVGAGKVSERVVVASLAAQRRMPRRIGDVLLAQGAIHRSDLLEALELQVAELVYEAVRWARGRFVVYVAHELPDEARQLGLRIPVHHLLLEGMRRLDEWQRLERELGGLGAVVHRLDHNNRRLIESLRPEHLDILEQIDGERTLDELVVLARRPTYQVFRTLADLRAQRIVTLRAVAMMP